VWESVVFLERFMANHGAAPVIDSLAGLDPDGEKRMLLRERYPLRPPPPTAAAQEGDQAGGQQGGPAPVPVHGVGTWLQLCSRLVASGQLELVGGGYVSHDEAVVTPTAAVDQVQSLTPPPSTH
jgi:hypothetical protein